MPRIRICRRAGKTPSCHARDRSRQGYRCTWNTRLLTSVPPGVVTFTGPLVAPTGTLTLISVAEFTVKLAFVPLKVTLVTPVRFAPTTKMLAPTLPELGNSSTKGARPMESLKIVPSWLAPPIQVVPYKLPSVACSSPLDGLAPSVELKL